MPITRDTIEQSIDGNALNLSSSSLMDSDIEIICAYLKEHPEICSLNVKSNNIGYKGAKALAANTSLTLLDLRRNQIGDEGATALAANTSLTSLDLHGNQIGDEGAKALAANTSLTSLNVFYNQIGDEGAKALAANTILTSLDFSWNEIGDEGINAIMEMLERNRKNISREASPASISMMVLSGFMAAVGVTAIALAFTLLNAATLGVAGVALA
ncbi:MAG: hypothetical protein JJT82_10155, partial [Legionellaceae bacterium]|nr:hypothetical protein [Legionellaceae bacterium]